MKFLTIFALLFCAACAIASEQAGENQEAQLDLSAVDFGVSNEEVVDEGVDRVKRHGYGGYGRGYGRGYGGYGGYGGYRGGYGGYGGYRGGYGGYGGYGRGNYHRGWGYGK